MVNPGSHGVGTNFSAREMGFPPPAPPPVGNAVPGFGGYTTPHFLSFSALVQTAARTYRYTTDQALANNPSDARAMWRDVVIYKALRARQRPVAQLGWSLEPKDETDPAEVEASKLVTEIIEATPRFQQFKVALLNAAWFGKCAVEIDYQWETWYGRQVMTVRDWTPVNGDKLRFKWDGTPGVLVSAMYPGSWEATDWGMAHFLTAREREQYVIHKFEPDDADWVEGELAGAVHGVGLRGRVYWFWWLKQQVFALMLNYLERFSNGLTIFYYDAHNTAAKEEAEAAAKQQFSNTALLYPRWLRDGAAPNGVERLEVGTASPTLLWNLVDEYFDPIITQAFVGQTLSSDHTGSGGLGGGGVAKFQSETLDEIIAYDAIDLADTIQNDFVKVLYRYNAPGVRPGKFDFAIDTPNSEEILGYASQLYEMGMALDGEELRKLGQVQKPKPGGEIVSKIGAMQQAAMLAQPQGVPVAGPAGPAGGATVPSQGAPASPQAVPGDLTGQATPAMAYRRGMAPAPPQPRTAKQRKYRAGRTSLLPKRRLVVA